MNLLSAIAWTLGRLLPVDRKKVVISSFYGRGCSDSPKAIAQELLRRNKDLKIVCLCRKNRQGNIPEGITVASYGTFSRIYHLSTAAVWIDNCRKGAHFKKKGQFYLQTWHGFALKRIEADAQQALEPEYPPYARRDSEQIDLIVSGSRHMEQIYQKGFWYDGEVLLTGTPRNDIFFGDTRRISEKVRACLGIPEDRHLVLYAPTFRADHSTDAYRLDAARLLSACRTRFGGDWTLLVRLHPSVDALSSGLFAYDGVQILDASMYDDIQELLCASDAVITDYSSVMFDFALTGRPCFQFATDIAAYQKDRDFYFPLGELPFPLAEDNASLEQAILHYDRAEAAERWAQFTEKFGIQEDGGACVRCADLILRRMGLE